MSIANLYDQYKHGGNWGLLQQRPAAYNYYSRSIARYGDVKGVPPNKAKQTRMVTKEPRRKMNTFGKTNWGARRQRGSSKGVDGKSEPKFQSFEKQRTTKFVARSDGPYPIISKKH